jgi:hypothetical protein
MVANQIFPARRLETAMPNQVTARSALEFLRDFAVVAVAHAEIQSVLV